MSIKIDVRRDPKTNTTEYHLQVHALVRVPDEVIELDQRAVDGAIAERLRQTVVDLARAPGVRFNREIF